LRAPRQASAVGRRQGAVRSGRNNDFQSIEPDRPMKRATDPTSSNFGYSETKVKLDF